MKHYKVFIREFLASWAVATAHNEPRLRRFGTRQVLLFGHCPAVFHGYAQRRGAAFFPQRVPRTHVRFRAR